MSDNSIHCYIYYLILQIISEKNRKELIRAWDLDLCCLLYEWFNLVAVGSTPEIPNAKCYTPTDFHRNQSVSIQDIVQKSNMQWKSGSQIYILIRIATHSKQLELFETSWQ